jgi:hypothetical protein
MDKPFLLRRLCIVRERAEAAHLEVVLHSSPHMRSIRVGEPVRAQTNQVAYWQMMEQKLLRELDWLLDQLEKSTEK